MFAPFETIRIINLVERRDRRREMERELARIGLTGDPRVAYFPAIRPSAAGDFTSIGARGVYQSQLAILREAAEAGRSVLILEDDCDFTAAAAGYDFGSDWDIFYGGYYATDPGNLHTSDIVGAHMMGFTAAAARRIVAYLDALTYEGIHPPIDAAYIWFRRAYPEVATRFAVPPLGIQRSSRSDIATIRFYDRNPITRPLANLLRHVVRARRRARN